MFFCFFFFSSRRRHTRCLSDWSSDVCSSDLAVDPMPPEEISTTTYGLPAPHRKDAAPASILARADAAALRALTGTRVTDDPLAFALAAATAATSATDRPDPVPSKGEALATCADLHATKS